MAWTAENSGSVDFTEMDQSDTLALIRQPKLFLAVPGHVGFLAKASTVTTLLEGVGRSRRAFVPVQTLANLF